MSATAQAKGTAIACAMLAGIVAGLVQAPHPASAAAVQTAHPPAAGAPRVTQLGTRYPDSEAFKTTWYNIASDAARQNYRFSALIAGIDSPFPSIVGPAVVVPVVTEGATGGDVNATTERCSGSLDPANTATRSSGTSS